jgi:hypothetical protein
MVISIAALAKHRSIPPKAIAVATFYAGFFANALLQLASEPDLKIRFESDADGHRVCIDNCDYSEAVEPKVFFDLVIPQSDGSTRLIDSN